MHWAVRTISAFSPQLLEKTYGNLTPSRKEHIDRLQKQEDRIRSLAAEALALQLLQERYGLTSAQLHRKENGQPYLTGCELFVSLSHSGQMVACAVSDQPVGIDIERIRPVKPNLIRRVCVAEELNYVLAGSALSEDQPCEEPAVLRRFFEVWTGKEAYFKKCGTGITDFQAANILTLPRQTHTEEDYLVQII
jgi:4'-phosphopantetheinyl transferase